MYVGLSLETNMVKGFQGMANDCRTAVSMIVTHGLSHEALSIYWPYQL
jgi:hypothetical protein